MANNQSILICEDDFTLISILKIKLTNEGFTDITLAEDFPEAKKALKEKVFDLVITDINMPNGSGLSITHYIRKDLSRSTPIIIMSVEGHQQTILEAYKLGANDFITKPITSSEIILRIKKLLHQYD